MADVSWSTFPVGDHPSEWIHPGDDISQSDLDITDAEYEELKALGAIRDVPYPIPRNEETGEYEYLGSPREYALAQLAQMSQDEYDASVVNLSIIPQLQARNQAAMDETGYDETGVDAEATAAADTAEAGRRERGTPPPGGEKVTNKAGSSAKDK